MKPRRLGLTGSIGMGKSTTAAMFADEGVPVWDADSAVARLYAPEGAAARTISALHPAALRPDGSIDRDELKRWILADPPALKRLETAIHPLVAADRAQFLEAAAEAGSPLVLLDIPLLYETAAEAYLDAVIVVTAPPDVQGDRVLARPGMTPEQFALILSRQIPDKEKRRRADYVIRTDTLENARAAVRRILAKERRLAHA